MSDLKTLKDIYEDAPTPHHNLEAYNRLLREEVIKRVKVWEIQKIRFKEIGNDPGVNCVQQIQNEFKEFFNITEEDLK